jgi:hypothetical protein
VVTVKIDHHGTYRLPNDEWIRDDDPDRDRKMADRLSGREPGMRSMHGPNGFAQPHLAPDWWREKHGLLSLNNPK